MHALLLIAALAAPAQWTMSSVPTGGTQPVPVVMTGDNSGGVGTLRIRPSDEDTQIVLCEASNNATPEMCTSLLHYNSSTAASVGQFLTNAYQDSAGTITRHNTSAGYARFGMAAGTAAETSNQIILQTFTRAGALAGDLAFQATGSGTGQFIAGASSTVSMDLRGPIYNAGSATCDTAVAGATCILDDSLILTGSSNSLYYGRTTGTTGTAAAVYGPTTFSNQLQLGWYGSSADADYASSPAILAVGGTALIIANGSDISGGNPVVIFKDNTGGTGATLADIDGAGRIRPLLYGSQTDCTDNAGAAACGAAPTGAVVIDDGSTTVVVSTTAVTANSSITVSFDPSLGTKLGITCNTTQVFPYVSARTAATSFTITSADPAGANKSCLSFFIVN